MLKFATIMLKCFEEKDVLVVLPTGFGKSLIHQALMAIFHYLRFGDVPKKQHSLVIVVSPLNALTREKLERFFDVYIIQSIVEDGDQKVTKPAITNVVCFLAILKSSWIAGKSQKFLKARIFRNECEPLLLTRLTCSFSGMDFSFYFFRS